MAFSRNFSSMGKFLVLPHCGRLTIQSFGLLRVPDDSLLHCCDSAALRSTPAHCRVLVFCKNWHINLQNEFRVFQSNVDVNQSEVCISISRDDISFFCLLCMLASRGTWQLSFDKRHSDPQQDSFSRTSSCSNRAESTLTSLRIICVMHRYGGQKFFFVLFSPIFLNKTSIKCNFYGFLWHINIIVIFGGGKVLFLLVSYEFF